MGPNIVIESGCVGRCDGKHGWIEFGEGKNVGLTVQGLDAAKTVLSKHMLSEWLLADVLDVSWANTHEQAHMMEHSISDELVEKIIEIFSNPETIPSFKKYETLVKMLELKFIPVTADDYSYVVELYKETAEKGWDREYERWIKITRKGK